ncbi:hypothetical protein C8R43DRAFT_965727 [Mycena crocata]|nr:hypothetical protein C8R43DRAFT_965727 [Mycena crocata]
MVFEHGGDMNRFYGGVGAEIHGERMSRQVPQMDVDEAAAVVDADPATWFAGYYKAQIIQIVLQHQQLSPKSKRTVDGIIAAIRTFAPEIRDAIQKAALVSPGKRKRTRLPDEEAVKRRRLDVEEREDEMEDVEVETLLDGPYLRAPEKDTIHGCIQRYIDGSGNFALAKHVCMVCARRLFVKYLIETTLHEIPNKRQLIPIFTHAAHNLKSGYLVHDEVAEDATTFVCEDCISSLKKNIRPRLALSNGMWIGRIPLQLNILTLPERLLIALYFPAVYVVKMFPKDKDATNWDAESVNSGMRGNVSSYKLHRSNIDSIVCGNAMPPAPTILSATIAVTFVGAKNMPLRILPSFLTVRRRRVKEALIWLKANNWMYAEIEISEERLAMLPICDVPVEIVETTRYQQDPRALEKEQTGYVPTFENEEEAADDDISVNTGFGGIGIPGGSLPVTDGDGATEDDTTFGEEPAVMLLQASGVVDTQADTIPDCDLMAHAMSNTARKIRPDEFAIRRGSAFVNEYPRVDEDGMRTDGGPTDPNHMLGAFPVLFPYGKGGIETAREQEVSYEAHVRWALLYSDGRFRKDLYFIFQAFGVLQKRQVCRSAGVQIKKNAFIHNQSAFMLLTPKDLEKASAEETRRVAFSNPVIQSLRKQITAVRTRFGEGQRGRNTEGGFQQSRHSKPPKTDNGRQNTCAGNRRISAIHTVPSMTMMFNPPAVWCTINLADVGDPVAQVLAGEDIDLDRFVNTAGPRAKQRSLNIAQDPFAAAEYFHVMINLILAELFGRISRKEGVFGLVNGYIGTVEAQGRGTLHLHILLWLVGAPTAEQMRAALKTETFREKVVKYIGQTIKADIKGKDATAIEAMPITLNVAYDRPIDPRTPNYDYLTAQAEAKIARTVQFHNCTQGRCKKFIGGRWVCKRRCPWALASRDWIDPDGEWGPRRLHGRMNNWNPAILLTTHSNHDAKLVTNGHETKDITWYITLYIAKKQIQAANASALLAEGMKYHRKNNAHITDCKDINKRMITQCANTLSRQQELSGPETIGYLMGWGDRFVSHHFVAIFWDPVSRAIRQSFPVLAKKSFVTRAAETLGIAGHVPEAETEREETVWLEFANGTVAMKDQLKEYADRGHEMDDVSYLEYFLESYDGADVEGEEERDKAGRPRSTRVPYLEDSKRKGCRIIRGPGHETLPRFVGSWFPRDTPSTHEYYCANILALLCPWRNISDLKDDDEETFHSVYERFMAHAEDDTRRTVANVDYFHQCSDASKKKKKDPGVAANGGFLDVEDYIRTEQEREEIDMQAPTLTEEDVERARDNRWAHRELNYGMNAVFIAKDLGIFPEKTEDRVWKERETATFPDMAKFQSWGKKLAKMTRKKATDNRAEIPEPVQVPDDGTYRVAPREEVPVVLGAIYLESGQNTKPRTDEQAKAVNCLNSEQRRAHDIVENHLIRTLAGQNPPQLLMIVQGEGGTGKTVLLNAITHTFVYHLAEALLAKTATTGVAASLIAGQTLHSWAGSVKSAVGGKGVGSPSKPFGGMNVILFGDPHQFPPVGSPHNTVYSSVDVKERDHMGHSLWAQFSTVVTLTEQKRVPDWDAPGWDEPTLVTPRHGARTAWNLQALMKHCAKSGHRMYVCQAEDTKADGGDLSLYERVIATGLTTKKSGKLAERVELAVGMRAMILLNIATESDLANGTRGEIVDIYLDPREPKEFSECERTGARLLKYPPALILFKPNKTTVESFEGLPQGILPVIPSSASFRIQDGLGRLHTIHRRQFAVTPGYAFTDYKSQGQTIDYLLVDLEDPPGGKLTPFSAYVALSRCKGRHKLRLLRGFDKKLFTTHPSADLAVEDSRLERLTAETQERSRRGLI